MIDEEIDDGYVPGSGEEEDNKKTRKGVPASGRWLKLITDADKDFAKDYDDRCEGIEKNFADMDQLNSRTRDREFALFWANIQVIRPSIYSRPPVPVVQMRFKRKNAIGRAAAEMLEACAVTSFEMSGIDRMMKLIRDDLSLTARGVAWVRYESDDKDGDRVFYDWLHRKDFRHEMARCWPEVGWVARRAYMTKAAMKKRFKGKKVDAAAFQIRKGDDDGDYSRKRTAEVWEIWHKDENKTVWVTQGVDEILDEGPPPLKLHKFFPCPEPAYATVKAGTLKPIADFMFYKDQVEEVNDLTVRIHSLSESLRLKGFYPSGQGELGDAIEKAIKNVEDRIVLIPIYNWALTGNASAKDMILWLPIREVAEVITALVALRKQVIDDVYQITGISDIMRGSTEASETLGAQQLKSQYGSVRVRDRQEELVRLALEVTRISCEIMAEEFSKESLLEMSQFEDTDIKTDAEVRKECAGIRAQITAIQKQVKDATSDKQLMAQVQQNPEAAEKAKQMLGQAQQQVQQLEAAYAQCEEQVTIEQVVKYLRDEKVRPYSLEIETDSTIQPDENSAKQRATEFITGVGGFIGQVMPIVGQDPEIAPLAAEMLQFAAKAFRADRQLLTKIEEYADQIMAKAKQPRPPSPEQQKMQAEAAAAQQKAQLDQQEQQGRIAAQQAEEQRRQSAAEFDKNVKTQAADHEATLRKQKFDLETQDLAVAAAERRAQHDIAMETKSIEKELKELDVTRVERQIDLADVQGTQKLAEGDQRLQNGAQNGVSK